MTTMVSGLAGLLLVISTAALAQTPLTGTAAPSSAPSGVLTPAPVPQSAPGLPGVGKPVLIPEQVAPSSSASGPANSTPFSTTGSGIMGNQPGSGAAPDVSR